MKFLLDVCVASHILYQTLVDLGHDVLSARDGDEFTIALEQVVAGAAPVDYRDPAQFFSRTCMTHALKDHAGMVLRSLAGETGNTSL